MKRRTLLLSSLGLACAAAPSVARAGDVPSDVQRLVLDTGRVTLQPAEGDLVRLQIHGEEQLRGEALRAFPLDPTETAVLAAPGLVGDSIGQHALLSHWLRLSPTLQVTDKLSFVGQADLTGLLAGDLAHDTWADPTPRDSYNGYSNLQPRWLYVEWLSPVGLVRAGQQPSHWGMGLVANDGDHPSLFGDYRYGNLVEQVLFATRPLGAQSPFVVAVAGNLVYRDNFASLASGDRAWQGALAAFYERGSDQLGLYGVYRRQSRDRSTGAYSPYVDTLEAGLVDLAGRFARPLPLPDDRAYVFGSFEAATELGRTTEERTIYQSASGSQTRIQSYGGAATLGVVLAGPRDGGAPAAADGARPDLWGRFVAQVEVGYASGDANPYDDTEKRFAFDPNHKVGLLLFDEVMRWQTARAAVAAQDPNLSNALRPPPGTDLLPSGGGVVGAQYVYPTAVVRPRRWLDLKLGAVIAQATADVVDPYRLAVQGAYVNYQGGNPRRHDLGVEVDGGFEARADLDYGMRLQLGAQAGVLAPGGALADASGAAMRAPWVAIARAGLQF